MPVKIKRMFEAEYGKKKGDRIFYAWQNKRAKMVHNHLSKRANILGFKSKIKLHPHTVPIKNLRFTERRNRI